MVLRDIYVSADVETDGPIPGVHSLLSFGFAVAGEFDGTTFTRRDPAAETFYRELRPTGRAFEPAALAVSGLDRARLLRHGADPAEALKSAADWVGRVCATGRPVLVAYPAVFDFPWLHWYFMTFTGSCPFGFSGCLDIKTMYAVKAGVPLGLAVKARMPAALRPEHPHTHHALDDAVEQAELFANLMEWAPPPAASTHAVPHGTDNDPRPERPAGTPAVAPRPRPEGR